MSASSGFVFPVSPERFEWFVNRSQPAPRLLDDGPEGEEPDDDRFNVSEALRARLAPLLKRIPDREADYITLYVLQLKKQADIAALFGVTQAAVSYRIARGTQRLRVLAEMERLAPGMCEETIRRDLGPVLIPMDVDIVCAMFRTSCQSASAAALDLTQGRIRHRFFKAVGQLRQIARTKPAIAPYAAVFELLIEAGPVLNEAKHERFRRDHPDEAK